MKRISALIAAGVVLSPAPATSQMHSLAGPVPAWALETRRAAFLDKLDGAPAIIAGARIRDLESEYLQDSDFRQDNQFFYLTGLEVPRAWLLLNVTGPGATTLYLPPRNRSAEAWTGVRLGPGPEATAITGIDDVRSGEDLDRDLRRFADHRGTNGGSGKSVVYLSTGAEDQEARLSRVAPSLTGSLEPAAPLLAELRLVKDSDEVSRLRRAAAITSEAHREAMRLATPGITEYELEAAIEYVFRAEGAERLGFPSIVGSGPNSTVLHYDKSRRRTTDGDLVVVDIGAEWGYYTADVTRTFPVNGRFTDRQRAIYDLVLGAQQAAIDAVRPGVTIGDLTGIARDYIDEHSGDLCGSRSCNRYFIHGLSHWLGMDVHDVGSHESELVPGMVLTIEPGIYLPDEALGVRIEDDVLVTENGFELLTGDLPRDAGEIEALMREAPRWIRPR
ncbi:MAG: aminopeptidase P family protein [Gemmatimonadetes bacterium]|nr:aminopeptidase P family protein [Gemmatimonadota bacterium]